MSTFQIRLVRVSAKVGTRVMVPRSKMHGSMVLGSKTSLIGQKNGITFSHIMQKFKKDVCDVQWVEI